MKKNENLLSTLGYIYNSTFIPIHYYRGNSLISSYPLVDLPLDFFEVYKSMLSQAEKDLYYFSTKEFLYIGYCRNTKTGEEIVIGPVSSTRLSDGSIDSLISSYMLSPELKPNIRDFYLQLPLFSLSQLLNILALVNKELTGNTIDLFDSFSIFDNSKKRAVGKEHQDSLYERKESELYHDTYFLEQEYYGYIERGDVDGLNNFIKNIPSITEGRIAQDSIRQAKNIFITSIALSTRRAIAGGLDIETAYQLSDSYIQEAERMSDAASITLLNATAVMDFTRRVSDAKIPMGMKPDIYQAIQYISNHVNKNLTVSEVAEHLNMDRSALSKKFKKELGFNISSYIMRRKLEEAKSLLTYSDKTVSEISEYLCFSTQSYFQNVFKAKYGITPKKFRDVPGGRG